MVAKVNSTTKKTKVKGPSNLFRVLSNVFLVNSTAFAAANSTEQTSTLALAAGKPIEFVQNFTTLSDRRIIREGLLSGRDVSREMEFNGIVLSPAELQMLKAINPILVKIGIIGPNYPWLKETSTSGKGITFGVNRINRDGHYSSKSVAAKIWMRASKYWSGGSRPPDHAETFDGNETSRNVRYAKKSVAVGCQIIPRLDLELIARHYGWS